MDYIPIKFELCINHGINQTNKHSYKLPFACTQWLKVQQFATSFQNVNGAGAVSRVSNPVFTETEKPGNPEFFQNRKTGFGLPVNPVFSTIQCSFSFIYTTGSGIPDSRPCRVHTPQLDSN